MFFHKTLNKTRNITDIRRNKSDKGLRMMRINGPEIQANIHHRNESQTNNLLNEQQMEFNDKPKKNLSTEDVEGVVEALNEFADPLRTSVRFELHEDLNEYYVTVVDPLTKEVIKEIPPKEMLDMYAAMATYMGILIDEKI